MTMDAIEFFILSILEVSTLFVFMFSIFRFKIKFYIKEIIFISVLISMASYYLRLFENLYSVVPIVLLMLIIINLWIVFKISPFYAAIMGIASYIGYSVVQALILWIMQEANIITLDQIKEDNLQSGQILQIISIVTTLLISAVLERFRLWFTFVPVTNAILIKINTRNLITLIAITISVIAVGSIFNISSVTLILTGLVIVAGFLYYLLYKRETT